MKNSSSKDTKDRENNMHFRSIVHNPWSFSATIWSVVIDIM